MPNNMYITKREAPKGLVAVTRLLAEALYNEGHEIILSHLEVNQFNVISGERRGKRIKKDPSNIILFETYVSSYIVNLTPKMQLHHAVFYARESYARDLLTRLQPPKSHRKESHLCA